MSTFQLNLPAGFEDAVALTPAELERQVRLMAAIKMFELGKLSSGRAAELAGVSRVQFIELCSQYGVPIADYSPEELDSEVEFLMQWQKSR